MDGFSLFGYLFFKKKPIKSSTGTEEKQEKQASKHPTNTH